MLGQGPREGIGEESVGSPRQPWASRSSRELVPHLSGPPWGGLTAWERGPFTSVWPALREAGCPLTMELQHLSSVCALDGRGGKVEGTRDQSRNQTPSVSFPA